MTIETIAGKTGLSARAVRYYVQTGIIDAPFGKGRGARYGDSHLRQIEKAKAMKNGGYTLEQIAAARHAPEACRSIAPGRSADTVIMPASGVRVSISADAISAASLKDAKKLDAALRNLFATFGF